MAEEYTTVNRKIEELESTYKGNEKRLADETTRVIINYMEGKEKESMRGHLETIHAYTKHGDIIEAAISAVNTLPIGYDNRKKVRRELEWYLSSKIAKIEDEEKRGEQEQKLKAFLRGEDIWTTNLFFFFDFLILIQTL